MKKALLLLAVVVAGLSMSYAQTLLITEDFETAGGDYGYTLDPANDCGCCNTNDMWGQTDGAAPFACSGVGSSFYPPGNIAGSFFFGVEDVDDPDIQSPPGTFDPWAAFILDTVNASNHTDLKLRLLLATPISSTTAPDGYTPTGQFEPGDLVSFQVAWDSDIAIADYKTFSRLIPNVDGDLVLDYDADDIGDEAPLDSALREFELSIPAEGNYASIRILFDINDALEEIAMDRIQVFGCDKPVAPSSIAGASTICEGESVTLSFSDGDLGGAAEWVWSTTCGGPAIGVGTSIDVAPTTTTEYFVRPAGGCFSGDFCTSVTVNVNEIDGGFITTTPTVGCVPHFVGFQDTTANAVSWEWDFGTATGGISADPLYRYDVFGVYDVRLVVTNNLGCRDTILKTDLADIRGSVVEFEADVTSGCPPLNVQFTDLTTSNGTITGWDWDFGDGSSSPAMNPPKTYVAGGSFDVILEVTDSDGCSSTDTIYNYITTDTISPISTCPADQVVTLAATCDVNLPDFRGLVGTSDFCDGSPTIIQNPAPGILVSGAGTSFPVKMIVRDLGGNEDSCFFLVNLEDATAPLVDIPFSEQAASADGICSAVLPDFRSSAVITEACDASPVITQVPVAGTIVPEGSPVDVWIIAEDASGNADSSSFTFRVIDDSNPFVVGPADQVINADATCNTIIPDFTSLALVSDACDASPVLTQDPLPGTLVSGLGDFLITIIATDYSGNEGLAEFTLNVRDISAPVINTPGDLDVSVDAACQYVIPDLRSEITIADACDMEPELTQSPLPGTIFSGTGTLIPVTFVATDESGNSSMETINLTLRDNSSPNISAPADMIEVLSSNCDFLLGDYRSDFSASDNCDPDLDYVQSPPPGSLISGAGDMLISVTVTDDSGNDASASFTISFTDNTEPTVIGPGDQIEVLGAEVCTFEIGDYRSISTIFDACDASPVVTQSPAPGTIVSGPGIHTIVIEATDEAGNVGFTEFDIRLEDQTAPVVSNPGDQMLEADEFCEVAIPDFRGLIAAADNCSEEPIITQTPAPGSMSGGAGTYTLIEIVATDASGNSSTVNFFAIVDDRSAPAVTNPGDQTVAIISNCEVSLPDYTGSVITTDNCFAPVEVTQEPEAGTVLDAFGGPVTVTVTATDLSGNASSESFLVFPEDTEAPVIACIPDIDVTVNGDCQLPIPDFRGDIIVEDNCDESPILEQIPAPGTLMAGPGLSMAITMRATDAAGNVSDCIFMLNAVDEQAPILTCPSDEVVVVDNSCKHFLKDYTNLVGVWDNCETSALVQSPPAGSVLLGAGNTFPISFTISDAGGNTATCSMDVILADTIRPTISVPDSMMVYNDSTCIAILDDYSSMVSIFDNCSDGSAISVTQDPLPGSAVTDNTMVTLTAIDESGNVQVSSFEIFYINTHAPVIEDCPSDIITIVDAGVCGAEVSWDEPWISELCTVSELGSSHLPGDFFTVGTTVVNYASTNDEGSSATCSFEVRVQDDEAPEIDCPVGYIITEDDLPFFYELDYSDNCDVEEFELLQGLGGGDYPIGTTTELYELRDASGNSSLCAFEVTVLPRATGLTDLEGDPVEIRIYPNPAKGTVFIDIDGYAGDNTTLRLMDAAGRDVELRMSGREPMAIDISHLSSGMYLLELSGEGFRAVERLIIVD